MPEVVRTGEAGGLAYREAGDAGAPVALCVHGFPETSFMWRELLPAIAAAGWRGVAPDLPGYGDSKPDPPATWERHVEALERFAQALNLPPVCLIAHDWGGLIGLRWACDNRGRVRALVLSDTGFFADGRWHGMADMLRTPDEGERLMDSMTPEMLGQGLRAMSSGMSDEALGEYSRFLADPVARGGALELYRSGDFVKLEPYAGCLTELGVPALCLWGENDTFAPVAGAYRFAKEIEDCEIVAVPDTGHFVYEDDPEACAAAVVGFLGRLPQAD